MSDLVTEIQIEDRWCPVCPEEFGNQSLVEPEVDGQHRYWECQNCGYAWGYELISEGSELNGACSMGVPEAVRRAASFSPEEKTATGPVLLGMPSFRRD